MDSTRVQHLPRRRAPPNRCTLPKLEKGGIEELSSEQEPVFVDQRMSESSDGSNYTGVIFHSGIESINVAYYSARCVRPATRA